MTPSACRRSRTRRSRAFSSADASGRAGRGTSPRENSASSPAATAWASSAALARSSCSAGSLMAPRSRRAWATLVCSVRCARRRVIAVAGGDRLDVLDELHVPAQVEEQGRQPAGRHLGRPVLDRQGARPRRPRRRGRSRMVGGVLRPLRGQGVEERALAPLPQPGQPDPLPGAVGRRVQPSSHPPEGRRGLHRGRAFPFAVGGRLADARLGRAAARRRARARGSARRAVRSGGVVEDAA